MDRLRAAVAGNPQQFDWLVERKDGTTRWVNVALNEATIGTETRLISTVRDASDRKAYEQELASRSAAMEASIDGIAILDDDEKYRFVNQAHAEIYCYEDPEAMVGETWRMCYDDDELERFETDVMPELFESGAWRGEATGVRADGSTFPQKLSLSVTDDGEREIRFRGFPDVASTWHAL